MMSFSHPPLAASPLRALFMQVLAVVVVLLLAGCGRQELYGQLTERQANEMAALLQVSGIDARKEPRDGNAYALTTPREHFSRAVDLLSANALPRGNFDTVGQIFKKEGFVSSPVEERARWTYALSQELASTLQTIDGVVVARVHLAVPEKDPLSENPRPASASVFIKHRAGRDLSAQVGQMKALVVNGVEGLPYDNVAVTLFAAEITPTPAAPAAVSMSMAPGVPVWGVAGLGSLLLLCGGMMWLRRRRQALRADNAVWTRGPEGQETRHD